MSVSDLTKDFAAKVVLVNVVLNPIFYGLCRKNYRKGYRYTGLILGHYLFCGIVDKPIGTPEIFSDCVISGWRRISFSD